MRPSSPSGWEFIDNSTFSYFIPLATDFNVEDAFQSADGKSASVLDTLECRDSLFFGKGD
jgi:hypothetical protein